MLEPLCLGELQIPVPIIQGGMGVKVSTARLAAAAANCGAAGTIASVGLAYGIDERGIDVIAVSNEALRQEIRKARSLTRGVVGVNIMVALSNFEELVHTAAVEGADFIASGAGLPLKLPELVCNEKTKLIPIVSSGRSAALILKTWKKRYHRLPDAFIIEGPLAGGHLGFKAQELAEGSAPGLEHVLKDVADVVSVSGGRIPLVAAGGIFDGADIAHFLRSGAQAVQMATRFVATYECEIPEAFKRLYLRSTAHDTVIIESPVGMPARALRTPFLEKILRGEKEHIACKYRCLKTCQPSTAPYCIAKALCNATVSDFHNAIVFAGSNVSRLTKIVSVKELITSLVQETETVFALA